MALPALAARFVIGRAAIDRYNRGVAEEAGQLAGAGLGSVDVDVRGNVKEFTKYLDSVQKQQLPFAVSLALNNTADDVSERQRDAAQRIFDRPTPFVLNGISTTRGRFRGKRANKRRLVASIIPGYAKGGLDGGGRRINDLLRLEIEGGTRLPKGRAIVVPTKLASVNKHGNLRNKQVARLAGQKTTFSAGHREGMKPGLYRRKGKGKAVMLVAYEQTATYRPIFPFYRIGEGVVSSKFRKNLDKAMARALRSARR